jgi:hypothetical protein
MGRADPWIIFRAGAPRSSRFCETGNRPKKPGCFRSASAAPARTSALRCGALRAAWPDALRSISAGKSFWILASSSSKMRVVNWGARWMGIGPFDKLRAGSSARTERGPQDDRGIGGRCPRNYGSEVTRVLYCVVTSGDTIAVVGNNHAPGQLATIVDSGKIREELRIDSPTDWPPVTATFQDVRGGVLS